jgi:PPE-repeat protein
MAQIWPATLQQLLSEASFGIAVGDTILRTDMDVGHAKTRRRFTKGVDIFTGSIYLTLAQYDFFMAFFNTTLNGGSLTFTFNHPLTQVPTDFRFKGAPSISSIGGGNLTASFTWEKIP